MKWLVARPFVFWLLLWAAIAIVPLTLFLASAHDERVEGVRLRKHGATASATVLRTMPHDHNGLIYEFYVDGKRFATPGSADGPEGPAEDLEVGQKITVLYDKTNPKRSCYCLLEDFDTGFPWLEVTFPLVFALFPSLKLRDVITERIKVRGRII